MITDKSTVTLHFSLHTPDGVEVDSNFGGEPATFTYGDGNLLPGVEAKLLGLNAGDERSLTLLPEDAFGQPNPANIQRFARSEFSDDTPLEPGLVLSFADAQKAELPGVVKSLSDEHVEIDFNHPLAGRELTFRVHILNVEN